jgi:hypothetical protein
MRPLFSRQTTAAAQLWPLYTTTSSRVLQRHLSDDGARADMEVASGRGATTRAGAFDGGVRRESPQLRQKVSVLWASGFASESLPAVGAWAILAETQKTIIF